MPEKLRRNVAMTDEGVALGGYDPVSYFSDEGPERGDQSRCERISGADWWFVSEKNRVAFQADPTKFMPQFGGHCVFGASRGQAFVGDPKAWVVRDGRLFLSFNRFVRAAMGPNPKRIVAAQQAWSDASE